MRRTSWRRDAGGHARDDRPPARPRKSPPTLFRHARTCSTAVRFNFGTGSGRQTGPSPALRRHPGLVPGSRETGRERCLWSWTPEQVRGDNKGYGRAVRASRYPSLDRTGAPEIRLYPRLAPGPPKLNRTAMDLFRASTSLRRLARARLAPRCRKTWMPGTSPGMTTGRERRAGECPCLARHQGAGQDGTRGGRRRRHPSGDKCCHARRDRLDEPASCSPTPSPKPGRGSPR